MNYALDKFSIHRSATFIIFILRYNKQKILLFQKCGPVNPIRFQFEFHYFSLPFLYSPQASVVVSTLTLVGNP